MVVSTDKTQQEPPEATGLLTPPKPGEEVFDGQALAVPLSGDVHDAQLIEEVYGRLGDRDAFQVVTTEGVDGVKTLHVLGDTDVDTVKAVAQAHTPDPDFGLDEDGKRLRQLRERLKAGEDLPASELSALMRAMF